MGSCTSTPNTPIGIPTIDENTFRIRQLDDRMRKKSGMILRLTNDMLIIEQRGRRHKPELSASVRMKHLEDQYSKYLVRIV